MFPQKKLWKTWDSCLAPQIADNNPLKRLQQNFPLKAFSEHHISRVFILFCFIQYYYLQIVCKITKALLEFGIQYSCESYKCYLTRQGYESIKKMK